MRTSRFVIVIRAVIVFFLIWMIIGWALNTPINNKQWSPWFVLGLSVGTVLLYGPFGWLFVRIGMAILHGNDPEYIHFKKNGGDPYFASLPWPFNPDSRVTRVTGRKEPKTAFVPPADWQFQCPACGARVQHRIDICWHCGYGSNGDSTAYFERYGVEFRPPEILPDEWERIRRRHGR